MDDESKQMHVDSLNVQISNHQSLKDCLPVIKHAGSSGKGFPYAPEDFPSPGDVWTWRVGKRYTHAGFWKDRSVHPPDRMQSSTGNKMSFHGRASLEQYIQETYPDADVDAFFDSFVWKIPCSNVAKDTMAGNKKEILKRLSKSPKLKNSPEEKLYTSHQSYFTQQEDVDSVLRHFGISGIETRVPGPNDRMDAPPEGFFAFTPIHIFHSCYLPFNPIISSVLSFLKITPIQLSPNSYSHINSLFILFRELKLEDLSPSILCSLVTFQKLKGQPEGSIYYICPIGGGVISDFVNKSRDWSHQFFYVRCFSPEIMGRFSVPATDSKDIDPNVLAKINQFRDATEFSRSRLRLLTEEKLRVHSLLQPPHRVLGEPSMMKKKKFGPATLVDVKLDVFTVNSPIQRPASYSSGYSPDVHLVGAAALSSGNDTSSLPVSTKAIWKSPLSKATPSSLISTAEDILALAKEKKRKSSSNVTAFSEPPFKKPKETDPATSLPSALTPSTGATIVTPPVQSPSINVTGSPLRDSAASLQQALGLNSPSFEDVPPPPRMEIPCASSFEELLTSILRSPATISSSETSSLSKETLTYLLQHLILIGRHLFNFQQPSSLSSQNMSSLRELNSSLSEKISTLEGQLHGLQSNNQLLSAEKITAMTLLDLEKKRSQELEDKVKVLDDTLAQAQQEISDLRAASARVPDLEKDLDKKDLSIGKLKSSLHTVKSKVSSFLNDVLPRWKDQISEAVLFTAYRDNIDRFPDMDFLSLHATGINYKRKFDILLDRIPGDYSEFEDGASIDPAKFLALDDLPIDDIDEESGSDGEDKSDDDNDDMNDGDGDSARNNLPRKDEDDDSNQGGSGAPRGRSHASDFPSADADKGSDKIPPPTNPSGESAPP